MNHDLTELVDLKEARIISIQADFPTFTFDNQATLRLECPWRIVQLKQRVVLGATELGGAATRQESIVMLTAHLLGKRVISTEITSPLYDLQIEFEADFRLDIFVQSALYESWHLNIGRKHYSIVSGGELSIFTY